MRVGLEIDAGNDAAGDGQALAADRIADDADLGFEARDIAEREGGKGFQVLEIELQMLSQSASIWGSWIESCHLQKLLRA